MQGVTGIYFDLDDTLCTYWEAAKGGLREAFGLHAPDSVDALVEHWAASFRELLGDIQSEKWYPHYLKSGEVPRTEVIRQAFARCGVIDEELVQRVSRSYLELRNERLQLFPDAIQVLSRLKLDYPLGLITNGPADVQRMEIDRLQIESYFEHIFIEGELGFGKPDPAVLARAAEAMQMQPSELLFVGNSYHHDILPAIKAGWKTVWVRRPSDVPPSSAGKPESLAPGNPSPNAEVTELTELLVLLVAPKGLADNSRGCNPREAPAQSSSPEGGEPRP